MLSSAVRCTEVYLERYPAGTEKKSVERSLEKICSKKGFIGWKPGYFQKKKFPHTPKSVLFLWAGRLCPTEYLYQQLSWRLSDLAEKKLDVNRDPLHTGRPLSYTREAQEY